MTHKLKQEMKTGALELGLGLAGLVLITLGLGITILTPAQLALASPLLLGVWLAVCGLD